MSHPSRPGITGDKQSEHSAIIAHADSVSGSEDEPDGSVVLVGSVGVAGDELADAALRGASTRTIAVAAPNLRRTLDTT